MGDCTSKNANQNLPPAGIDRENIEYRSQQKHQQLQAYININNNNDYEIPLANSIIMPKPKMLSRQCEHDALTQMNPQNIMSSNLPSENANYRNANNYSVYVFINNQNQHQEQKRQQKDQKVKNNVNSNKLEEEYKRERKKSADSSSSEHSSISSNLKLARRLIAGLEVISEASGEATTILRKTSRNETLCFDPISSHHNSHIEPYKFHEQVVKSQSFHHFGPTQERQIAWNVPF